MILTDNSCFRRVGNLGPFKPSQVQKMAAGVGVKGAFGTKPVKMAQAKNNLFWGVIGIGALLTARSLLPSRITHLAAIAGTAGLAIGNVAPGAAVLLADSKSVDRALSKCWKTLQQS